MSLEQRTWLLCSVSVISANKLSLQDLTQLIRIKLLISRFPEIFVLSPDFQGGQMPVLPPHPADAHGPLLCLQRWVAEVARGLFYCWSLLRNNNMATNPQRFTLYFFFMVAGVLLHETVGRRHLGR